MKFIIELNKGVAPFYLGTSVEPHLLQYSYTHIAGEVDEAWDEYDFLDNHIEIYVDKKSRIIESIACRENCYLDGKNLVNLSIEDFIQHFNVQGDSYAIEKISISDEEEQNVYDFDVLDMQLWVNNEDRIVTVFIYS